MVRPRRTTNRYQGSARPQLRASSRSAVAGSLPPFAAPSSGGTTVLVATPTASRGVIAYYARRMAELDLEPASPRLRQGAGRYPQPVALLARLGAHRGPDGHKLGAGLLVDVITRLVDLSDDIGCRGLRALQDTHVFRGHRQPLDRRIAGRGCERPRIEIDVIEVNRSFGER
jgi:hypothetical protein